MVGVKAEKRVREGKEATIWVLECKHGAGLGCACWLGGGAERQLEAGWQSLYVVAANTRKGKNSRRYPGSGLEGRERDMWTEGKAGGIGYLRELWRGP